MRVQNVSASNYQNKRKQQNFGMVMLKDLHIDVPEDASIMKRFETEVIGDTMHRVANAFSTHDENFELSLTPTFSIVETLRRMTKGALQLERSQVEQAVSDIEKAKTEGRPLDAVKKEIWNGLGLITSGQISV